MAQRSDDSLGAVIFPSLLTSVIAGCTVWFLQSRLASANEVSVFSRDDFFQPESVAYVADLIEAETEDEFIQEAWDWVGSAFPYEPVGSVLLFYDSTVECMSCYLPLQTLSRRKGNCVAKSSLLASILLTRIPEDRVRIVMGYVSSSGSMPNMEEDEGHAWVEVERGGVWYILESTVPPDPRYPWIPANSVVNYIGTIFISLTDYVCEDPEMCLAISPNCACHTPVLSHWIDK